MVSIAINLILFQRLLISGQMWFMLYFFKFIYINIFIALALSQSISPSIIFYFFYFGLHEIIFFYFNFRQLLALSVHLLELWILSMFSVKLCRKSAHIWKHLSSSWRRRYLYLPKIHSFFRSYKFAAICF